MSLKRSKQKMTNIDFSGIIAVKRQVTQKTNKPIRNDKRVECKCDFDLVECDNLLSCVVGFVYDDDDLVP